MKTSRRKGPGRPATSPGLAELRARLAEASETLRAIRTGEVDAVVVEGNQGPQVFTLQGADQAYRVLIESMNDGALTLTADAVILYANRCFAKMVRLPLEKVMGSSFSRFLSAGDRTALRPLLKRADRSGSRIQVLLKTPGKGPQVPAQISIRPLERTVFSRATIGMVVTDMTESRRNEQRLRALFNRLAKTQELERKRVAFELHDRITQLLCAILIRSEALADNLPAGAGPSKREAIKLREMLGQAAEEVQRISRNLRPSVLDEMGLAAVLRDTGREFADRTGVSVKMARVQLAAELPPDSELTLYRILQEALKNVEKHARARHVTVRLSQRGALVQLVIHDDGIGFRPDHSPGKRRGKRGLGLLSMRERANYAGGGLSVVSAPGQGTTIRAQIPAAGGGGRGERIS